LREYIPNNKINPQTFAVETAIRECQPCYRGLRSATKKDFGEFIKLVHSHELITLAGIRSVLHEKQIRNLYDGDIRICDKQAGPLGRSLCNFTQVSMHVPENLPMPLWENCPCRHNSLLYHTGDLVDGHVVSCDPQLLKSTYLRQLFQYGFKFRHNMALDTILVSLELGLQDFFVRKTEQARDPVFIQNMQDWKVQVFQRCKENLSKHVKDNPHFSKGPFKMCSVIKQLKEIFVIGPVDKAQHNLSFICKRFYQHVLSKEFSGEAYSVVKDLTAEQILKTHRAWNDKHKYSHVDAFPYLYWIGKFHKYPPKARLIAGVSNPADLSQKPVANNVQRIFDRDQHVARTSTTPASIHLSKQLQKIMQLLLLKDQKRFKTTGIRRCWFVRSAEEVYLDIKANQECLKGRKPRSFDFTTMYTKLQHDRIFKNVPAAIKEAFAFVNTLPSKLREDYQKVLDPIEKIVEHLHFIVQNTYLWSKGNVLRRQTIGIPMGTNASPEIANLTLYWDEACFMDQLETHDLECAKRHSHNDRYIDDILTFDESPPSQEIYGLEWAETTCADGAVNFLGGKIRNINGRIATSLFDKVAEWQFPFIRYPHFDSNVPYHQPSGVFQGQLCRFRVICNSIKAFKDAVTQLVLRLLSRGHKPSLLVKGWNKHLQKYCNDRFTNYSRLRQWFRRMLCWAQYHPLQPFCKSKAAMPFKQTNLKWVLKKDQNAQPSVLSSLSAKPPAVADKLSMPCSVVHTNLATTSTEASTLQLSNIQGLRIQDIAANTARTDFELQVLEYEEDERIDLHLRNDVKKLADSIRTRDYKFNFSSTSRVVCDKCDMHFWKASYIHTKKHVSTCQRAQSIKPVIHGLHSMDSQCGKNTLSVVPMGTVPVVQECHILT